MSRFEPARVVVIDADRRLPPLGPKGPDGRWHSRAIVLVRLGGCPIDVVDVDIDTGLAPGQLAERLWAECGTQLTDAAAELGAGSVTHLPLGGIAIPSSPAPATRPMTIVVATRNRAAALGRCLDSLRSLDHADLEIVVVDNAPNDDRAERMVARASTGHASMRYVREDRPGLAVAHNAALPFVSNELVAFTDDDVVVDSRWATALADAFDLTDDVGCVTGLILPAEIETPAQGWIEEGFGFSKGFDRRIFDLADHRPDDRLFPYTAGTLGSGANMAFTRSALAETGGFDESLGAGTPARGGDDLAAFFDVVSRGHRLVYEPAAIVHHHHHPDTDAVRRTAFAYGVGLSAYLTRTLAERPASARDFVTRLPQGVRHGLRTTRPPQSIEVPGLATAGWRRRAGLLVGPMAYARSRRQVHRHRSRIGSP